MFNDGDSTGGVGREGLEWCGGARDKPRELGAVELIFMLNTIPSMLQCTMYWGVYGYYTERYFGGGLADSSDNVPAPQSIRRPR